MTPAEKAISETIGKLIMDATENLATKGKCYETTTDFGFSLAKKTFIEILHGEYTVKLEMTVTAAIHRPEPTVESKMYARLIEKKP